MRSSLSSRKFSAVLECQFFDARDLNQWSQKRCFSKASLQGQIKVLYSYQARLDPNVQIFSALPGPVYPGYHSFSFTATSSLPFPKIQQYGTELLSCTRTPPDRLVVSESASYLQLKMSSSVYQAAKQTLTDEHGTFAGWIKGGTEWQQFDIEGNSL